VRASLASTAWRLAASLAWSSLSRFQPVFGPFSSRLPAKNSPIRCAAAPALSWASHAARPTAANQTVSQAHLPWHCDRGSPTPAGSGAGPWESRIGCGCLIYQALNLCTQPVAKISLGGLGKKNHGVWQIAWQKDLLRRARAARAAVAGLVRGEEAVLSGGSLAGESPEVHALARLAPAASAWPYRDLLGPLGSPAVALSRPVPSFSRCHGISAVCTPEAHRSSPGLVPAWAHFNGWPSGAGCSPPTQRKPRPLAVAYNRHGSADNPPGQTTQKARPAGPSPGPIGPGVWVLRACAARLSRRDDADRGGRAWGHGWEAVCFCFPSLSPKITSFAVLAMRWWSRWCSRRVRWDGATVGQLCHG